MKSVVVEIKNGFAVVLSDDGSIVKVKNKKYVIGQVIEMKIQKVHITKKMAMMVASAAIVVLTSGIGAWAYSSPYSYVSMDVNPSIEYTLNRFERVINVKAVNDDGQEILDEIDIDGLYHQSIENAILKIVDKISQGGYFDGETENAITGSAIQEEDESETEVNTAQDLENSIDGGIVITVSNENDEISEELSDSIREAITEFVSESVEVEVSSVAYERVQEAKELGITPGKLNLIEKLQASAEDPDSIVIEEWLNKSVKDIMKAMKENRIANSMEETEEIKDEAETSAEEDAEKAEEDAEKADEDVEKAEEDAEKADEDVEKAEEDLEKAQEDSEEAQAKPQENSEEAQVKAQEKAAQAQARAQENAAQAQVKAQEKAAQAQVKAQEKAAQAQVKAQEKAAQEQAKAQEKAAQAREKAAQAQENAKNNAGSEESNSSKRRN